MRQTLLTIPLFMLSSATAFAESVSFDSDQVYGGLEFGAMILGMPDTTYFAEVNRSQFTRLDNLELGERNTLGGTITGSLGMILPATFFSAHENSLQADLSYSQTRSSKNDSLFYDATHSVGAGFVVFENFPVVQSPDNTLDTHVKRDVDFYEADLLMRNAYDTYALLFGPSFKHLNQTNDFFGQFSDLTGPIIVSTDVNERLRAGYYGAAIGIATDHTPSDRWTMRSQNLISVYYSDFVSDVNEAYFSPTNLVTDNASSASQNGYAFGIKSRLAFGHSLSNGWDFDLVLTGQYLSKAPFIDHAQRSPSFIRVMDDDSIFGGSVTVSLSKSF